MVILGGLLVFGGIALWRAAAAMSSGRPTRPTSSVEAQASPSHEMLGKTSVRGATRYMRTRLRAF